MTYRSYQVEATTKIKSYIYLGTYLRKVFRAWTEVGTVPSPSTAHVPNRALWGRDLGDFRGSGQAGDIQFALPSK